MTASEWSNIPYEQKDLLLSLPVRAGIWISHFDGQGDKRADESEIEALSEVIAHFAAQSTSSPFVTDLFEETLKRSESWDSWQTEEQVFFDDCRKAADIFSLNLSKDEHGEINRAILEVCEVVAQAHGEFEEDEEHKEDKGGWLASVKSTLSKLKGTSYIDMDKPFNISPSEQDAIHKLRHILERPAAP